MHHTAQDFHTHSRLLAKVIRSVLATERFTSLADLTDAIKFRCARLRLDYSPQVISEAYALIAASRPLVGEGTPSESRCSHTFVDSTHCLRCGWVPPKPGQADKPPMTKAEAAAVLKRLGVEL